MDGVSEDGNAYRIYETPNATWIYAESFYEQNAAQEFCNAAGGTLAVPVTSEEMQEVFTLLKHTLTPGTQALPSYGSPPSGPFNTSGIFAAWIGIRRPMQQETWRTITGQPMISPVPWARGQPVDKVSCAVLAWKPETPQDNITRPSDVCFAYESQIHQADESIWPNSIVVWEAANCSTFETGVALPALCKLPAAIVTASSTGGITMLGVTPNGGSSTVAGSRLSESKAQ